MLYYLVYVSSATFDDASTNLNAIDKAAQNFNASHDITGLLLYDDGHFLQILEGDKSDVESLYERICRDSRNKDNILIEKGRLENRNFPHWAMKVKDMSKLPEKNKSSIHHFVVNNERNSDYYIRFVFKLLLGELRDEYQAMSSPYESENEESLQFNKLTSREKQVLQLLIKGHTPKKIGAILQISHKTVSRHIENMCTKIGCHNRGELIARVFATGYFSHLL